MVVINHFPYQYSSFVYNNRSFIIMNIHKRASTILLMLLLCFMLSNALFAQLGENALEKLILVDSQPFMTQGRLSHGYYVYRCKVQNKDVKPHKITLNCDNVATKSFDLQPGEIINASLPLPVTNSNFGDFVQINVDNRNLYTNQYPMRRAITSYPSHYRARYISYAPDEDSINNTFLICRSLRKRFAEVECIFAENDCKFWPQDRMDYSGLDYILLTPEELAAAPEGVQTALRQFVLSGGVLWLLESDDPQVTFDKIEWIAQLIKETPQKENRNAQDSGVVQYPFGFGVVALTDRAALEKQFNQLMSTVEKQFNQNMSDDNISDKAFFDGLRSNFDSKPSWFERDSVNELQKRFPVVNDLTIPLMGISIVILLFVLLAGPINLFILTKYNKRILLLVTVPVLSFLFAGAILSYVILSDGFKTEARLASGAYLDQRDGTYASLAKYGVYARTTPRNVVFDSNDELNCSDLNENESLTIDWTSGKQALSSRFATVRKPAYYRIRKTGTTRLKLDFDFNDTNPYIVNGLGKDVKQLYVRDPEGNLWKAESITAGQKAPLTPVVRQYDPKRSNDDLLSNYMSSNRWDFNEYSVNAQKSADVLRPGSYIATFSSSGPFVTKGISYAREQKSFAFLLGRF